MMDNEFKYLFKGKWEYNIIDEKLICRNRMGLIYVFENRNNLFFQNLLNSLNNEKPNINLQASYDKPTIPIPLELFHRILRSNEVILAQTMGIRQCREGLFCFSDYIKDFKINSFEYPVEKTVYIDPQRMCRITRRIKSRERVQSKLSLEPSMNRIILECEFPWTVMTIILPTIIWEDDN